MRTLLSGIILFIFCSHTRAQDDKPNVLFIMVDDLNDYVSVLQNYPDVKTPNLERLAKQSVVFENAHAAVPLCNPSRAAIMTGLNSNTLAIYNNKHVIGESEAAMQSTFLPELFKEQGYITLKAGKILHEAAKPDQTKMSKLWDEEKGLEAYGPRPTVPTIPQEVKKPRNFDYQEWTGPDTDFADVVNAEVTIERLGQSYDKPFFMALGFYRPHNPWTAPKRYFDRYPPAQEIKMPPVLENDLNDLPEEGKKIARRGPKLNQLKRVAHWNGVVRAYLACITFMDDQLGRVLDALEASEHADNTIIVLIADHGFHLGEKSHFAKSTLWERATRTLMMVKAPGVTAANTQSQQPVSLLDIYPTLVDLCGLPAPPQDLYGHSIKYLLEDPNARAKRYVNTAVDNRNFQSVRSTRWNYIDYGDGTGELYDMAADPNEWKNLWDAKKYANVRERLSMWLPQGDGKPDYERAQLLEESIDDVNK